MSCQQRHTTIFALYPEDILSPKPGQTDCLPLSVFAFEKGPRLSDSICHQYYWVLAAAVTFVLCLFASCKLRVFHSCRAKMIGGLGNALPGAGETSKTDRQEYT